MPVTVPLLVGVLLAAAATFAVAAQALFATSWHVPVAALLGFFALLTVAEYCILRCQHHDDVLGLNLFEAALVPALVAAPVPLVVVLVAAAQGIAGGLRRNRPIKALFNVAQWAAATGAAGLVFRALRPVGPVSAGTVAAVTAGMAALLLVNVVAFSLVMRLAQGQPLRRAIAADGTRITMGWAANLPFGILFLAAYQWSSATVALFFVPLLALSWAYGAYAVARADELRLRALHRASAALSAPIDPRDAVARFLAEVRECFEAEAAELVLLHESGRTAHRVRIGRPASYSVEEEPGDEQTLAAVLLAAGEPVRVSAGHADLAVAALLRKEGWRDCLAAPLLDGKRAVGMLCTYNRTGLEGFEEGELAVLGALADDVVTAVQKGRLVQAVLDERQKLSEIVNNTSDGILTLAPDGTVTSWNPALEEITGYRALEMVSTARLGGLRPRDGEGRDVMVEKWAAGVELPARLQVLTRDGEARWLSCSYTRVDGGEASPRSLIVVARDVTKAHELERLREDFVATVSHELRTPLAPIKGWAATLLEHGSNLGERQRREGMESILRQAQRLERLIVNLLEASKVEHGRLDDSDTDVDVVKVVSGVVDEFETAWPDRRFLLRGPPGPVHALGNELWIEQILSNLVSNAVKYAPGSEPVEIAVDERPGEVEVSVTDHGPGIPADELDRVFERFHRLRQEETQAGTGLGLFIARQLANEIGASVTVRSTLGEGARFSLSLRRVGRLVAVS